MITPMGAYIDDVVVAIENRDGWNLGTVNFDRGLTVRGSASPIGEMHVGANLGSYHAWYVMFGVPEVRVSVRWAFDEGGRLISIRVQKSWSP